MFDKAIFKLPHIHRTLAILVLIAMMEAACILGEAFGLSRALVALWEGGAFEDALWNLSLFACSFVCVRITLDLRESFISSYALKCARGTRKDLFGALFQTGAPLAQRFGTATSAAMALEGVDKMKEYLELVLPKLVNMMVLPLMFALGHRLRRLGLGCYRYHPFAFDGALMVLIGKTTAEKSRVQHGAFKVMSNHFIDSVRGLPTLSTFAVSKTYADRVYEVSERFREATMKMLKSAQLSGAVLDLFATLADRGGINHARSALDRWLAHNTPCALRAHIGARILQAYSRIRLRLSCFARWSELTTHDRVDDRFGECSAQH